MAASLMDFCRHGRVPEACDDCDQRAQAMATDRGPVDPCQVCQGERGFTIVVRCPACDGTGADTAPMGPAEIFAALNDLTHQVARLRYWTAQLTPGPAGAPAGEDGPER